MLGILCHDLGKPATTKQEFKPKLNRMAWVSPGHDKAGEEPAKSLLARIHTPKDVIRQVIPLVTHHMDHLQVTTDTQIRQLSVHMKDNSIFNLGFVTEADHSGRPPLPAKQPAEMQYILDRAKELGCLYSRPKPILQGKHIAQWSALEPGKTYGVLCNAAYEAQLKGHILDEQTAKEWFKANRGKVLENAKLAPPRLLDGKQLLPLYGGKPGPELGQLHRELFDLQIDGHLKTEEDAWKFVHANATKFKIEPHNLPVQMEVEI